MGAHSAMSKHEFFECRLHWIYSIVMFGTFNDSIAQFCGLRELIKLAAVSAQIRWGSSRVADACKVARDIMRGGSALDDVNKYSRIIRAQFPYGEARELSDEDFARRADVLIAYRFGAVAIDCESPAAFMGFVMRGERIWNMVEPHNALCMSIKSVIIGKKSREYFECIGRDMTKRKVAPLLINMMVDTVGVDPRIIEFVDHALAHDVAGARECIPEFSDDMLGVLVTNNNIHEECARILPPINAIGPNFARILIERKRYEPIIAHFAHDDEIFEECTIKYSGTLTKLESQLSRLAPSHNIMLSYAAKNPDPRAFEIVYDMLERCDCIAAQCAIHWNYCEGFEALQRAVRRIESRGIRVTFDEIMMVQKAIETTLPLYDDVIRAVDFMLARCAHEIILAQTAARAAHFGEPCDRYAAVNHTYDDWSIIKYLGWCCGLFGEHMSNIIARHLASAPWLVEKIKSRGAKQTWAHFDEVFKVV